MFVLLIDFIIDMLCATIEIFWTETIHEEYCNIFSSTNDL